MFFFLKTNIYFGLFGPIIPNVRTSQYILSFFSLVLFHTFYHSSVRTSVQLLRTVVALPWHLGERSLSALPILLPPDVQKPPSSSFLPFLFFPSSSAEKPFCSHLASSSSHLHLRLDPLPHSGSRARVCSADASGNKDDNGFVNKDASIYTHSAFFEGNFLLFVESHTYLSP